MRNDVNNHEENTPSSRANQIISAFLSLPALIAVLLFWHFLGPEKRVISLDVYPSSIKPGTATLVTVSAQLSPNPNLIRAGLSVRSVDEKGARLAELGPLRDDGSGTNTYTGQFQIAKQTSGVLFLVVLSTYRESSTTVESSVLPLLVKPDYAFPLKKSADNRYFVDQGDAPFLLVGDAPMSIVSMLSPAQQKFYFADRQAKGFNALWINLLCTSYTGCPSDGRTRDGVSPFTSGNSPENYDLSTPNEAYFSLYEAAIASAATYGHVVFLNPIETGGWLKTLEHNGTAKAFNYGVYVGKHFRKFRNLVWLHGNDYRCGFSSSDDDLVAQVMAGIATVDPDHLQTIEAGNTKWTSGADAYAWSNMCEEFRPYLGANLAYTWAPTYDVVLHAYNSFPKLPCFLGEGNYEYENIQRVLARPAGEYLLRETAWWTLLSGCMGYMYGSRYTWPSTWPANALDSPGAVQIVNISRLMNSLDWWKLIPDQDHSVVAAGYGQYTTGNTDPTTNNYCSTGFASDGSFALTYCPKNATLTVALNRFKDNITARWFDPSAGTFRSIPGSPFENTGTHEFRSLRLNSSGHQDWILVLTVAEPRAK